MIELHDKQFVPFISASAIAIAIAEMVTKVEVDLKDEVPIFIGVLNGSFMVVADFVKNYTKPCEVSFVKLNSYKGTETTHKVKQLIGINEDLTGRTVVILEDIIDTGNTLVTLKELFASQNLKSLKIATLFFKPEAYKKDITIDYIGMRIPNKFIVGYGLDYDGLGRNLPEVYQLKD